jgi:hypothetical protein
MNGNYSNSPKKESTTGRPANNRLCDTMPRWRTSLVKGFLLEKNLKKIRNGTDTDSDNHIYFLSGDSCLN